MKRFWETAAAAPEGTVWTVRLDGKPLRLPGGGPLAVPSAAIAAAIAAEWQQAGGAKGGEMSYADVPLTRLAGTAQERIVPDPEPIVLEIARYGETDLLCYRADGPAVLAQRQHLLWQPWLDWAAERYAARLAVTEGIVHVAQSPGALANLAAAVAAQGPFALAALGIAVPALGSLVLGLAVADGALEAAAAHELSILDDVFQEELWGSDTEALKRRAGMRADLVTCGRFLALLRTA
ncbi:MAG: chaperone, ATP12 [Alphaproteobacteria bacterium]|nr:chaperone, ATP12 [Alphaproteobacteria bacterium]